MSSSAGVAAMAMAMATFGSTRSDGRRCLRPCASSHAPTIALASSTAEVPIAAPRAPSTLARIATATTTAASADRLNSRIARWRARLSSPKPQTVPTNVAPTEIPWIASTPAAGTNLCPPITSIAKRAPSAIASDIQAPTISETSNTRSIA